jgi:hypothetical protein
MLMQVFAKSLAAFAVLLIVGFAAHAKNGPTDARSSGRGTPFAGSIRPDSPLTGEFRNAVESRWIIYYRLEAGGQEYLYTHQGVVATFLSKEMASSTARNFIRQKKWASARWRQQGR